MFYVVDIHIFICDVRDIFIHRYCELLEREAAQMVRTQHNIQKLKMQHQKKAPTY
jgi:hypothetical protein